MSVVRPAVPADAAALASILNGLLATTTIEWRDEPYSPAATAAWMEAHECVLVAEHAHEVVGLAAFGPFRDSTKWPGYRFTVEHSVHVRPDQWRTGVGRRLMDELVAQARAAGKHAMIAAVDGANTTSIDFHRRLGFAEVARLPEVGAKFGQWQDLVLLELRLDGRAGPDA